MQLEIVLVNSFFQFSHEDFKDQVTPSWLAILQEGLSYYNIQIRVSDDLLTFLVHSNDDTIEEEVIRNKLLV